MYFKGRIHSVEIKAKLSLAMKNKKPKIETYNKMKLSHNKSVVTNIININIIKIL